MKKNYFIIALIVALAICIAFLFWPDKQHDTHNTQRADVIADHDTLKAHGAKSDRIIDSLNKSIAGKDSAIISLKAGQQQTRKELDKKTTEANRLAGEIKAINKDTGYLARKVDSLIEQVQSLTFLLVQYEQSSDSLNTANEQMKISYEARDKEKDKAKAELQTAYDKLFKAYQTLFAETTSLQKDLRRQKLKTKIAAVLGAAVGVLGLVK